ncbi:uncharacterized protein MELLADRAFT_101533 [Melampsora larici-populina 98AG31]|uniref:Uncharacterized protein n=1 Tax=Melampsora larici-populina (strain 98AG31 / pathotype 3-4-7) TaxID=747676 RepID=F4R653_MELLP|nr:uncharacterized protein MELLADRAFT_101533 [Melampsora larici-populina 98AG31]EGG11825.1 hypothetical protein MELLADRAFT_101533 [Melampsora larici-populina 98AG31]
MSSSSSPESLDQQLQSSRPPVLSTPVCCSTRLPTPCERLPGMVVPSSDSQTVISLPQATGLKRKKNTPTEKTNVVGSSQQADKKRKKSPSVLSKPLGNDESDKPLECKMNQDSNNGLTYCQKAKILESSDGDEEGDKGPEYEPVEDHFGTPVYEGTDVTLIPFNQRCHYVV